MKRPVAFTTVISTPGRRRVRPARLTAVSMPVYPAPTTTILLDIVLPLSLGVYRGTGQDGPGVNWGDSGHTVT
ncbi:hypothetical protein GCM10023107_56820 [Actinoplanes octamycinicus]|nr:hypothetical protein Aoc01nite_51020 [Actinoplanes octamycinicus]